MSLETTPQFLAEPEAAKYIGMSRAFLRLSRCEGEVGKRTPGPPFYRIGRTIRYKRADLDAWIEEYRVEASAV